MATKLSLLFLSVVLIASSTMAATNVDFSRNSAEFSMNLYSQVVQEKPDENVILSPLSIQTAVALAFMGSKGKTADEIVTGLRLGSNERSTVAENFKGLLDSYKGSKILKIANKIYTKNGYEVKPEFKEIATNQFHSDAESVDFSKSAEAAQLINTWVEDKTNNKIKDLITSDALDDDTRMVLVNAIHFKGDWAKKFDKDLTRKKNFHTTKTESFEVDMMTLTGDFKYGYFQDLNATALEMDYKDSDLSMLFILPNEIDGITELEKKLLNKNLIDLSNEMFKTEVNVQIPKFKIEFSVNLNEVLKKMGMGTMFSNSADFSNLLVSPEPLKVSEVVHKAFIEVNEEGAEAAAATEVELRTRSGKARPYEFNADKPFYFAIRSKDVIVFNGNFLCPKEKK